MGDLVNLESKKTIRKGKAAVVVTALVGTLALVAKNYLGMDIPEGMVDELAQALASIVAVYVAVRATRSDRQDTEIG